jgi:glycosyltransferase involved in cell wall biosynthesis
MVFDNKDIDFANLVKLLLRNNLRLIYQQQMQLGISKRDLIHTFRFSGLDYWISPLEWLKQQVIKQTHVKEEKIKVIPLGVEVKKYITPKYTKSDARQKLQIKQDSLIIGIIGRIDPLKGQFFLVQAIKNIREQNIPIEILIVGEPTIDDPKNLAYFRSIQDYIRQENLEQAVHIRDYTSDVNLFYNAIDVFALASKAETVGMVTIEAMLSGVPIIATNSAGTPEILQYGNLGKLYTPNDMEDFCTKLIYIITHMEESLKQAGRAQNFAVEKFSHQTECDMIKQLLIA